MNNAQLLCSKLIGEPINTEKKVPFPLSEIVNTSLLAPGDIARVYTSSQADTDKDTVYIVGDNILVKKVIDCKIPTILDMIAKKSPLHYVPFVDLLNNDVNAIGRKKASISRAFDKLEIHEVLDGVMLMDGTNGTPNQEVTVTGDLYDTIMDMKHKISDYGTDFVLLVGSNVSDQIDTYDKENAESGGLTYNMHLKQMLAENQIQVIKVFSEVSIVESGDDESGGSNVSTFDSDSMVMIARRNDLVDGRPITLVRRQISAEIATAITGVQTTDPSERLLCTLAPLPDGNGSLELSVGCFAFGQYGLYISAYPAVCWADFS